MTTLQTWEKLTDKISSSNINPKNIVNKIPRWLDSLHLRQAALSKIKNVRKLPNKAISEMHDIGNKLIKNLSEGLIVPLYITLISC